ncbi:amidase domain-containing protein [Lederbergia sp. NSJ-179]|uniref:amidase domain-containing protein n=1 Tax=Lederbergia sp. NSJ-179 TaxID=2931402 RepID=UPI001FD46183|nr:amidase domain-containing protein [Lederbergia sp. NSJ-179]MCJ7840460.1 amidase domain-containing protein [Lederbergia sp. NSJ-179]
MRKQLISAFEDRIAQLVRRKEVKEEKVIKKLNSIENRKAALVKAMGTGKITSVERGEDQNDISYQLHLKYLIKQSDFIYIEEEIEHRMATFYKNELVKDIETPILYPESIETESTVQNDEELERVPFMYDRLKAVRYAEKWWNDYNPAYEKFEVDCTNFISQCLHVGGAPMRGYPNRSKGWWYQNKNWSYSWSVANALKVHLESSTIGLRAKEVKDARELKLGDVICYDFQGDGRYDHNTIVTGKDAAGEPLVNAHTYNSRMRYWAYEDSSAYTPNIQYKMFTIIDDS